MDQLQEWIDELRRRQDNIDPIRRIPNGALFQGTLIKGNLRLSRVQRVGAVMLGLISVGFGCFGLARLMAAVQAWRFVDYQWLPEAIFCPISLWFGWKITVNALINDPRRAQKKRD